MILYPIEKLEIHKNSYYMNVFILKAHYVIHLFIFTFILTK